jgi:hypothetical protein
MQERHFRTHSLGQFDCIVNRSFRPFGEIGCDEDPGKDRLRVTFRARHGDCLGFREISGVVHKAPSIFAQSSFNRDDFAPPGLSEMSHELVGRGLDSKRASTIAQQGMRGGRRVRRSVGGKAMLYTDCHRSLTFLP